MNKEQVFLMIFLNYRIANGLRLKLNGLRRFRERIGHNVVVAMYAEHKSPFILSLSKVDLSHGIKRLSVLIELLMVAVE